MRFGVNGRVRWLLRLAVWCALLVAWAMLTQEACAQTANREHVESADRPLDKPPAPTLQGR